MMINASTGPWAINKSTASSVMVTVLSIFRLVEYRQAKLCHHCALEMRIEDSVLGLGIDSHSDFTRRYTVFDLLL